MTAHEDWTASFWPAPDHAPGEEPGSWKRHRYVAIPRVEVPRYVVPEGRQAAAAAMRHFNSGGSMPTRARNRLMRASLAALGILPGRSERLHPVQTDSADSIESYLSQVFQQPVRIAIYFGPPRANRKPILQVIDHQNRPIAFAKVGINNVTRRLVKREGQALQRLARYRLGGIRIPEVKRMDQWNGLEILILSPLPTWRADHRVTPAERCEAMRTVSEMAGTHRSPLGDSDYLSRLSERVTSVSQEFVKDPIHNILEAIAGHPTELTFGSWHGDWTQWNMAKADGEFLLWDWERFETDVPVGFDPLHYAARIVVSQKGPTPQSAGQLLNDASRLLNDFGVPDSESDIAASLYLVDLALRYTRDAQRDAGGRSGRVEEWILPALQSHWSC